MLTDRLQTSPRHVAEALDDVAVLRRRTRRSLGAPWFPMVCFGALTMLSAPVVAAEGPAALALMWLPAGAAGMLLTRRHYQRRARANGVTGRQRRAWKIAGAMFVGCMIAGLGAGMVGGQVAGVLAPMVVVLAGYLALGWQQRDPVPSLAVVVGATLAAAIALAGAALWLVELAFGATLVAAGVGLRLAQRRP